MLCLFWGWGGELYSPQSQGLTLHGTKLPRTLELDFAGPQSTSNFQTLTQPHPKPCLPRETTNPKWLLAGEHSTVPQLEPATLNMQPYFKSPRTGSDAAPAAAVSVPPVQTPLLLHRCGRRRRRKH